MLDAEKPRRRRLRFTLRTCLVLLTVFCVWIGFEANRAHEQRIAVEQIQQVAGIVLYDRRDKDSYVPRWLRSLAGDDFFRSVVEVNLHTPMVGRTSRALTPVELDKAVAATRRLAQCRRLKFDYTQIRDDDLARLAPLGGQLESLYFNEFHNRTLTGAGLRHLSGWPRLQELSIYVDNLDPGALKAVAKIPHLERLTLGRGQLDADAFAALGTCGQLRELGLFQCAFDGQALARLKSATRLESISLHNTRGEDGRSTFPGAVPTIYLDPTSIPPSTGTYQFRPLHNFEEMLQGRSPPQQKLYKEWLERTLPGVKVHEWSSS